MRLTHKAWAAQPVCVCKSVCTCVSLLCIDWVAAHLSPPFCTCWCVCVCVCMCVCVCVKGINCMHFVHLHWGPQHSAHFRSGTQSHTSARAKGGLRCAATQSIHKQRFCTDKQRFYTKVTHTINTQTTFLHHEQRFYTTNNIFTPQTFLLKSTTHNQFTNNVFTSQTTFLHNQYTKVTHTTNIQKQHTQSIHKSNTQSIHKSKTHN